MDYLDEAALFDLLNSTAIGPLGLDQLAVVPELGADSDSHSSSSGPHSPDATSPDYEEVGHKRKASTLKRRDPQARREQNRNAQRAFRDRRERRMVELEARCDNLEQLVREQREANARLQATVATLRMDNSRLRRSTLGTAASSLSPPPSSSSDMASPSFSIVGSEPPSMPLFENDVLAPSMSPYDLGIWSSSDTQ